MGEPREGLACVAALTLCETTIRLQTAKRQRASRVNRHDVLHKGCSPTGLGLCGEAPAARRLTTRSTS
ncbi:MAG: hypothetical protein ACFE0J_25415 [Elainellaceae cyanobacterium]